MELTQELVIAIALLVCCTVLIALDKIPPEYFEKIALVLLGLISGTTYGYYRGYMKGK